MWLYKTIGFTKETIADCIFVYFSFPLSEDKILRKFFT